MEVVHRRLERVRPAEDESNSGDEDADTDTRRSGYHQPEESCKDSPGRVLENVTQNEEAVKRSARFLDLSSR